MSGDLTIYLAGPIMHSADEGVGWRRQVRTRYPDFDWIDPAQEIGYDEAMKMEPWELVQHDKGLIDGADGLLVGYEHCVSIGTWREVEYAKEFRNIPIAVWMGNTDRSEEEISHWAREPGHVSESLSDCLEHISDCQTESRPRTPRIDERAAFMIWDALEQMTCFAVSEGEYDVAAELVEALFLTQAQLPQWQNKYHEISSEFERTEDDIGHAMRQVATWAREHDHDVLVWFQGEGSEP